MLYQIIISSVIRASENQINPHTSKYVLFENPHSSGGRGTSTMILETFFLGFFFAGMGFKQK